METKNIQNIYIYAPDQMKNRINSDWDTELKKLIVSQINGNYVSENPIDLLKKIKNFT